MQKQHILVVMKAEQNSSTGNSSSSFILHSTKKGYLRFITESILKTLHKS